MREGYYGNKITAIVSSSIHGAGCGIEGGALAIGGDDTKPPIDED
jgi:hypothetical protein